MSNIQPEGSPPNKPAYQPSPESVGLPPAPPPPDLVATTPPAPAVVWKLGALVLVPYEGQPKAAIVVSAVAGVYAVRVFNNNDAALPYLTGLAGNALVGV